MIYIYILITATIQPWQMNKNLGRRNITINGVHFNEIILH
jgi:hypothetical protein